MQQCAFEFNCMQMFDLYYLCADEWGFISHGYCGFQPRYDNGQFAYILCELIAKVLAE